LITNYARWTREIKSRIALEKAASKKKRTFFSRKLEKNLEKKLVKCHTWSILFFLLLKPGRFGKYMISSLEV
jgi:S-adenosylmethionine:diacylglycerol 3-amino-3-carboxypropyl transferase